MSLLYHAYVYLEFLILACTIYILAPSSKYIKMDKVYFGLSDTDDIIEICVCDMSVSELEHLKKELELQ